MTQRRYIYTLTYTLAITSVVGPTVLSWCFTPGLITGLSSINFARDRKKERGPPCRAISTNQTNNKPPIVECWQTYFQQ